MTESFTDSERAALAPYVSNLDSPIFALRNLPEEVIAVLFAYYSRSADSLRRNLLKLLQEGDLDLAGDSNTLTVQVDDDDERLAKAREKARAFHEKWVVGYGHSSVAEHGCVHLALENVSIIASKLIEDARLASYTEKSTRYVAFDAGRMYYPPELRSNPVYVNTIRALLDAYTGWTEDIVSQIKARVPRTEKQTERGYETACRASAFDVLRYLLPSATYTNIGLTLNARSLETMITKLLSQPLPEGRVIGEAIKREARHIVPTLLKYADHNAYRVETQAAIEDIVPELPALSHGKATAGHDNVDLPGSAVLVHADPDVDDRLVASILYDHTLQPMDQLLGAVKSMDGATKEKIVDSYLCRRGKHDAPGRALERIFCTVEMTMDYGAYRDIQRHRMATQSTQGPHPHFGFAMPPEIERFGYADRYTALMKQCETAYTTLVDSGFSREAAYVLPLATRMRALFTWNLREVTHFIELRSSRQGHPSYRHIAQEVYRAVEQAFPLVARYIRPNMKSYDLTRD